MKTKILCSAICVVSAWLALSCRKPVSKKNPLKEVLNRHLASDPPTLDPTTTGEELGLRVEDLLFRPLIGLDAQRRFIPGLAISWTASQDGLVYALHLDPKARWENGTPVTSKDVAFTIEHVRDPKVPAIIWRPWFEDVVRVETLDDLTAIVKFRHAYSQRLFAFTIPVVAAAAYERPADTDRKPFGSGPYRLESWISHQTLTLRRREDASSSAYPFSKIVFRIVSY